MRPKSPKSPTAACTLSVSMLGVFLPALISPGWKKPSQKPSDANFELTPSAISARNEAWICVPCLFLWLGSPEVDMAPLACGSQSLAMYSGSPFALGDPDEAEPVIDFHWGKSNSVPTFGPPYRLQTKICQQFRMQTLKTPTTPQASLGVSKGSTYYFEAQKHVHRSDPTFGPRSGIRFPRSKTHGHRLLGVDPVLR